MNRIHVGPDQGNPTFTPRQLEVVESVLNRYFKGWLGSDGTRSWNGHIEQLKTYSIPDSAQRLDMAADPFQACFNQLKGHFRFAFLMVERNGIVTERQGVE